MWDFFHRSRFGAVVIPGRSTTLDTMTTVFDNLRRQTRMSIIQHVAKVALPNASAHDKSFLERILASDNAEEVWALCCDAKGDSIGAHCFREARAQRLERAQKAAAQPPKPLNPVLATRPAFA